MKGCASPAPKAWRRRIMTRARSIRRLPTGGGAAARVARGSRSRACTAWMATAPARRSRRRRRAARCDAADRRSPCHRRVRAGRARSRRRSGRRGKRHHLAHLRQGIGLRGRASVRPRTMRDFLVNRGRAFIFSTAPSPLMASAVRESLRILADEPERRERLAALIALAERTLASCGSPDRIADPAAHHRRGRPHHGPRGGAASGGLRYSRHPPAHGAARHCAAARVRSPQRRRSARSRRWRRPCWS